MKIQFGQFKGRNIKTSNSEKMRPTSAIAKSMIFNTIKINDEDTFIDIFAGTGALGFEAISAGAKKGVFFDLDRNNYKQITQNIIDFKIDKENFKVFNIDFRRGLSKIDFKPTIIFLDPPFSVEKYYDIALNKIKEKQIMAKNGIIILEKPSKMNLEVLSQWDIFISKKLGEKEILFLKYKND